MSLVFNKGIMFCGYPLKLENCIQELESSKPYFGGNLKWNEKFGKKRGSN